MVPGFDPMAFNTAVCFVSFSIALLNTQSHAWQRQRLFFFIFALFGTLIGVITLLEFLFRFNSGIDELFVTDHVKISPEHLYAGRMAFNAAVCFALLGAGLLMAAAKKQTVRVLAQYLFHTVSIISAIALIGYIYGVSLYHTLLYVSSMSPHTAVLFLAISIAASLLNPSIGMAGLFTGRQIGNKLAQRLFLLTVVMALVFGTVRLQTQRYGLFSMDTGVALLVVCFLIAFLIVIWNIANWLNKIEQERSEAAAEVKRMNAELEKRVEERTAESKKNEEKYQSLIEQASDAIYLLDANMNFTDVNESMCRMMGYSKQELLKMHVQAIVDPEELKTDPLINIARSPHKLIFRERSFMRKDKSIFPVEINVKVFPGHMTMVMARDVSERKRIEVERSEAELKFRTLAEKSMVGVYISQNERFNYVNPRFAEIFGYEPHELINTETSAVNIIIDKEYQHVVRANIQARYKGEIEIAHYEVKGRKKDGSENWIEFYGNRVIIDGKPAIIGTMLDITERKGADDLILKEKMLSDTIINSLPGPFYLINENGNQIRWNTNYETVTGYSSEELQQLTTVDIVAPEDHEKVGRAIERVFEEGYAVVEASIVAKDGTKTQFLLTGTPILYEGQRCLLGMGIDISSRVKAEEELRVSEQKYKVLFDSSPMPLWMIDKDTLCVIAANDAAAELYGYTKAELVHMSAKNLRPDDDQERLLVGHDRLMNGEAIDMGIVRHLKKDGTPMFVHIVAHDIIFEDKPVRLSFTNDVTERLKAEESLQKSEANLQTILRTTNIVFTMLSKDLEILAFNPKAAEFIKLHYNRDLRKGQSFKDYLSPERAPQVTTYLQKVLKGRTINYEVELQEHWYYVNFAPITSENREILGMLITLEEITERKNAEQDLKKAYSSIQNHINSIKGMAWKQSHLMRSPLANLKALADLLREHPADTESLAHFQTELDRLDAIIHEMAQDASDHVM
jgi:PAS domain S-box-containing protein